MSKPDDDAPRREFLARGQGNRLPIDWIYRVHQRRG